MADGPSWETVTAEHGYDPWWRPPVDPEADRKPTPTIPVDELRANPDT